MMVQRVLDRREECLRKHLLQAKVLEIRVAKRRGNRLRIKLTNEEVSLPALANFAKIETLFGPKVIGNLTYPKRLDLVGRPTLPRRAEAIVIELKAGRLNQQDLRQLLGYITFLRYVQTHGGLVGLQLLSKTLQLRVTRRTRFLGLLIGRSVSPKLMEWIPEEVWELVRICRFKVTEGKWPDDLRKIRIYDHGYTFRSERNRLGKLLHNALNQS